MGTGWHVPEQGGPPGIEPGFYCEDQAALDALLADPTVEHASVPAGAPSPLVHGQRVRIATPAQAEVLRWFESRPESVKRDWVSDLVASLSDGGPPQTWMDWQVACLRARVLELGPHTSEMVTPAYTASLDAARAFVRDVLPGFWVSSGTCALTGHAGIGPDYNGPHGERLHREWGLDVPGAQETFDEDLAPGGDHSRECRAILACAVRALIYKQARAS